MLFILLVQSKHITTSALKVSFIGISSGMVSIEAVSVAKLSISIGGSSTVTFTLLSHFLKHSKRSIIMTIYIPVKNALMDSYKAGKKQNIFTKTKIDKEAHRLLCLYFSEKKDEIEQWFNVISPDKHTILDLKEMLCAV